MMFALFRDREFLSRLVRIALPIILQQFITSSLGMIGVVMIGQLGDVPVAAVGLANQVWFVMTLLLFGIASGSAMFAAQLWGKEDLPNIHKVLGLSLLMGIAGSSVFVILSVFFPRFTLGIYTADPAVISMGSQYLQIIGPSFLLIAITSAYSFTLRSTGDVRTPLFVSMVALSINMMLSYLLIFGVLGLPRLGVAGAAWATDISRVIETGMLLWLIYSRGTPAAARLGEMFSFNLSFAKSVLRLALPVAFNELFWSLGITAYTIVYAHIGTDAIAAINISSTVENLAFVIFLGICDGSAILIGHRIGAGEQEKAYQYALRSLGLGAAGAVGVGVLIGISSDLILSLYKVSPLVIQYARNILLVVAFAMPVRVANLILIVGIFRSGGDTRFAFLMDVTTIWAVGVPLAFLGGFVFHLPIYGVYLLVVAEECVKCLIGLGRFLSKKWINNLTQLVLQSE